MHKIKYLKKLNQREKDIIDEYWMYDRMSFKDNNKIALQFNIDICELIKFVKENSICLLLFDNCSVCKKDYLYEVNTRSEFIYINNRLSNYCSDCKPNHILINKNDISLDYFNFYTPEYALENKLWVELSTIELEILKKILLYKDKFLIYKHVFKGDVKNKEIWNIIQHIEDLGLIWINRDESRKIISFEFLKKIKNELLNN